MIDPAAPCFVPMLLPADEPALAEAGTWDAAAISVACGSTPRLRAFAAAVRSRCRLLIVDPKTAQYQYEGYMSMEDLRSVPYGPGRATLGSLWQPRDFARPEARGDLAREVMKAQEELGAGVLLAPYFLVSHREHPWLGIAADAAAETLRRGASRPLGVIVCVEIDALLHGGIDTVAAAFAGLEPDLFGVIVVNHDEVSATPAETGVVIELVRRLAAAAPVTLMYAGRSGLLAVAAGAAACASGALELEAHPKRYLREGLVNLHANAYYLPGALVRLPVRLAAAVAECVPAAAGELPLERPIRALVSRQRVRDALCAKRREVAALGRRDAAARLCQRIDAALAICTEARRRLEQDGASERLAADDYHYLEVVRELAGGPAARIPEQAGF